MIFCYNNKKDSFAIYGLEIVHASNNGTLRLYDKRQRKFFKDINCKEVVDVKGEKMLTRAISDEENGILTEAILREGGEVVCNEAISNSNIRRWPKFIQTQRKMTMIQGTELLGYEQKQLQQILDTVSDNTETLFFKTKSGDFSRIITKDELLQPDSILRRIISRYPDEEYILSQPVQIEQDRLGNKEYRSIIIDNIAGNKPKVASISRYSPDAYHEISAEVLTECKKIAETISSTVSFPEKYVLDIVEYKDYKTGQAKIDVLGVKPINLVSFTGLYNSIDDLEQEEAKTDEQLRHSGSHIYDIAPEKKRDFIEKGEIPSALGGKSIVPLEEEKKTPFAKAYKLGHDIVKKARALSLKDKLRKKEKSEPKKEQKET